jgi:CRP/FNR family transcriptional regulator, cyclic AMP receptor protein
VAAQSPVRLLAVEPDVGRFMTADERAAAEELLLPVREVGRGPVDVASLFGAANAFAAFILDGMVLHRLQVADQPALRLLGPGDLVSLSGAAPSVLAQSRLSAAAPTRLAMLGNEILAAARRWPRIVAGLHVRATEQGERLGTQLAICQLPRVDQRLLALMWLLAESWGIVTSHGTRVPLALTHDALGGLIGARRPTVTLALRELAERGAVVRQSDGWLLLEGPPEPSTPLEPAGNPALEANGASDWTAEPEQRDDERQAVWVELQASVVRLREQHRDDAEHFQQCIARSRHLREQAASSRRRLAQDALSRRRAPSS